MKKPKVHPVAEMFPMMSEEDLDDLAADIKANGLLHPIVLDSEGILIDGRNRLEACRRAEIEPSFETLDGIDPIAFIIAQNVKRRHLSAGQQAMAVAFAYPEQEKGGRGRKANLDVSSNFSQKRLSDARKVLAYSREWGIAILNGTKKLDKALEEVNAALKELQSDEVKLKTLSEQASDLANLVTEERLPLDEAWATFEKRKHDAEEDEKSQRETMYRVGESSYRGIIAWSVDEFCKDVEKRLEDQEFRLLFIQRARADKAEIPNILKGAKALTAILNKVI